MKNLNGHAVRRIDTIIRVALASETKPVAGMVQRRFCSIALAAQAVDSHPAAPRAAESDPRSHHCDPAPGECARNHRRKREL